MFFFTSCSCFWIFGILECIFLLFLLFSFENFESVFGIRIYAVWGGGVKGVKHLSLYFKKLYCTVDRGSCTVYALLLCTPDMDIDTCPIRRGLQ